ncbi:MAG: hypothetical protein QGF46_06565, partial [Planctomycetota bacterium]|nr:hypothetical protein [Planctomycetota bacterium]
GKLELNLLRQFARANGKTALSTRPATAPHPDFDWNSWQYPSDENQINSAHLQTIKLAFSSRSNDE